MAQPISEGTDRGQTSMTDRAFFGQPAGLSTLFFVELWERFSYYGMRAILAYYLYFAIVDGGLGLAEPSAVAIVSIYGASVYLLGVVGGFLADRVMGAWRATLYGGIVIMAGHISLAIPAVLASWTGIVLVAIGTGLLKPNISTMVGELYDRGDPRRDSGFSIFYMSINIGSFFSPLIVGTVRERWGFHAGFSVAAVGMAIAVALFVWRSGTLRGAGRAVHNPLPRQERGKVALWGLAALAVFAGCYLLAGLWRGSVVGQFIDAVSFFAFGAPIAYFVVMFRSPKVSAQERSHLLAYVPLWVGAMLFFMVFEQAAGKMAVFAEQRTVGELGPIGFQAEWFQSINPLTIVILAPLFAVLWRYRAGKFPSLPAKFALGVTLVGISALMLAWMFASYTPEHKAPVFLLAACFIIQTLGELCLSPVGLSATTLLAPAAFASQAMALWFLASSAGQALAAQLITAMKNVPDSQYYLVNAAMTLVVSGLLFALVPWTRRKMADVEEAQRAGVDADRDSRSHAH
ncbi:MAG: oligopeptide:H+ symporter [Austwickia sp.]|nr:oligopeptide:H+ symporter [Actinomycetota bacterium]MCB1253834.1 oligopeptide:H+ symporter [Austwickia sp.]MCO5310100.1 oligopeptide:H+ symporter [Austwickia sp.]